MIPGKVIYSVAVSIDGFIAAPDGSFDWLLPYPPDADFSDNFLSRVGGVLMGRACFDLTIEAEGTVYPDKSVAVMTHRPIATPPENVEVFAGDLAPALAWLRRSEGDVWLFGGSDVAAQALGAGIIDEIHTAIVPVTLGKGMPLFGDASFAPRNWELFQGTQSASGYFMLNYRRVPSSV